MAAHETVVCEAIKESLPKLEDELVEYFAGILTDSLDSAEIENVGHIHKLWAEGLESYQAVLNEAEATKVCNQVYQILEKRGIFELYESVSQKKRRQCAVGELVMAKYYDDGEFYEATIDELEDENFWVTYIEYGNSELVTIEDIHILKKEKSKTVMKEKKNLASATVDDAKILTDKMNKVFYKRNRCATDFMGKDLKKGQEHLLGKKARKALKKEREKMARYDPKNYKKVLKQTMQEEWFDISYKNRSRTINIEKYDLYTLDDSSCLLKDCSIKLVEGKHYGLVGKNGCGKTTLLRRISRYDIEDFPKYVRVMHVEQEITGSAQTVMETVLEMDIVLVTIRKREAKAIRNDKAGDPQAGVKLAECQKMRNDLELNEEQVRERAKQIMKGLSFTEEMLEWPTSRLSGGWRMRVSLAGALFVQPDILMLDEPTNHLDFPSVVWLENYLKNYQLTLLIVSHDRQFLSNVCDTIIHHADGELNYYKGNFAQFVATREETFKNQLREFEAQKQRVEHIQAFIDRWRANAKKASMVQSRIKTLKAMIRIEKPVKDGQLIMEIPQSDVVNENVCQATNLTFGYTETKLLFKKTDFNLDMTSRVGVIGANGAGKSTMVHLILGDLEPLFGKVDRNRSCRIASFTQHHVDQLDLSLSPIEMIHNMFRPQLLNDPRPEETIRNKLGGFGLTGDDLVHRPIGTLSGGQKSRVAFTIMTWKKPNFIILDEPTNHLDMETIDALIEALKVWKGGVLIVSHDQHFLQSVCQDYWIVANKGITRFKNFDKAKVCALKNHKLDTL